MATKKKEEELAAPEAQSGYDTSGLENRQQVEEAMAGAGYRPGQSVTDAANALKEWQDKRPEAYQSSYQDRINEVLDRLLARENFAYSYTQDPLYRQYAQQYTQNAHNASADAAAQAAALTGGYGSSYAASAAQQAYQQQIGALNEAIPSLYSLALDTYTSGGDELVSRLDQLNAQEQSAQERYDRQLSDYYTQLQQKGEDYNNAYAQDYGQYQDYLSRLDTLLNTGYNIVSGTRAYEADRADTAWNQQMQEKQRQDSLTQQRYENEASERAYQDALKQQAFNNSVTSEKLNIAKGEWALKQSNAQAKASRAAGNAAAKSSGKASGSAAGTTGGTAGTNALKGSSVVPFTAALLRSRGKSDTSIANALQKEGYTTSEIAKILQQMNQ